MFIEPNESIFFKRFALRNKLSISVIVNNQEDLAFYLDNENIEIHVYEQLDDRNVLICYRTKDELLREHSASNLIVALWSDFHIYFKQIIILGPRPLLEYTF